MSIEPIGNWPTRRSELARAPLRYASLAAACGRSGTAPFLTASGGEIVDLDEGRAACGFVRRRRWAITPGDVVAPLASEELARSEYLDWTRSQRLRPIFVAVEDPRPFVRRAFSVHTVADEAIVALPEFTLSGSRRANLRHSVRSARRAGIQVRRAVIEDLDGLLALSDSWLANKRGGELGFTLSRAGDVAGQMLDGYTDAWMATDSAGRPVAWSTWRHYRGGDARLLDVMRRAPDAPNPAMDALLATCLAHYRDVGLQLASLAAVPRSRGAFSERVYPTRGLWAYKNKFSPLWEPRWLAVQDSWRTLGALRAVAGAYCSGGLARAIRGNK